MIKKEITLRAGKKRVWDHITSDEYFSDIWQSTIERGTDNENTIRLVETGETVKITRNSPPNLISFFGGYGWLPLTTTLAVSERRNLTSLKITVHGWENMDENEIRYKIPVISYEWERRLAMTKKMLESGQMPVGRV